MSPISHRSTLRILLGAAGLIAGLASSPLPAQTINLIANNNVRIIGSSTVIRESAEALQIGWNEEWWKTQQNWFNTSTMTMNSTIVSYQLNNQAGARYRFPGGTNSNYLDWSQTIGPVGSRVIQWAVEGNNEVQKFPYFGFDEFMDFVSDVDGEAVLVLNMQYNHAPDPLTPAEVTQWAQKAADWVEYCNAPNDGSNPGGGTDWAAIRATNGHAAPYNVKLWELGNELDWGGGSLTVSAYVSRCQTFMTAMLAIDPTIKFIAHARTTMQQVEGSPLFEADWTVWHRTVIDTFGNSIAYVTGHAYYDGINVQTKINNLDTIRSYSVANVATNPPKAICSEHGTWTNEGENYGRNSGIDGAIGTADFLMAAANRPGIAHAWEHTFDGAGRWLAFYNNTGTWKERPISQAETIMQSLIHDNEVCGTTIYTPNNSGYGGGYDVRSVVTRDQATGDYIIGFINRHSSIVYSASIELQGLPAGTYAHTKTYLTDPSGTSNTATNYLTVQTASGNVTATSSGGYGIVSIQLPARSVGKIVIAAGNPPPTVSLTSPTANASYTLGSAIPLAATASDANGVILVEFYHGGTSFISDDTGSPFTGSWTPSSAGSYTLTAKAYDGGTPGASATSVGVPVTVVAGGGSTTEPFPFVAAEDGWVLESTETSNVGGSINATNTYSDALRIGDDGNRNQFKVILSFDTSGLPDNATITAATLRVTRGIPSYNPSAFVPLKVDIRTGGFNGNNALENADFQAPATAAQVATMNYPTANGDVSTGTINASGLAAINKTGRTQFRLYFNTDDDNDAFADYLGFWSGEAAIVSNRPVLEITYTPASNSVPSITTASLPGGTVNVAYTQPLAATGGDGALVWSIASGALPAGLSLSSGGVVSGTPTTAGTANFTVRVADSDAVTGATDEDTQALSIVVAANTVPNITTTTLPGGTVNVAYTQSLAATGGDGTLVWSIASGALPAGLSLSSVGVISGTPTTAGTANFTVRVADSDAVTGATDEDTQALSIVVAANTVPNITTTTLPGGTVSVAYSQSLAATGGDGALVWSIASGALPAGLSLSSGGVISGTPTTAGTANFTVRVADSDAITGATDEDTQALSIVTTGFIPFMSTAAYDGRVLESSETSNVGGSFVVTDPYGSALRVGDEGDRRQIKSIVSFDTSTLPDGATIVSATLKLRRGAQSFTLTGLGTFYADIRTGPFNGNNALENADFQAPATATQVATMSLPAADGDLSTGTINATGRAAINKTGVTQFRLYFSNDDDGNTQANYLAMWAGEAAIAANRPLLEITYQ